MAHLISKSSYLCLTVFTQLSTEGGIFWCYGLLTFARFLGSFADLGWAWNVSPSGNFYTAEFTESFVIFLYGLTNTWMERFGANPGDPFTTKQIQHISIAVRASCSESSILYQYFWPGHVLLCWTCWNGDRIKEGS